MTAYVWMARSTMRSVYQGMPYPGRKSDADLTEDGKMRND